MILKRMRCHQGGSGLFLFRAQAFFNSLLAVSSTNSVLVNRF